MKGSIVDYIPVGRDNPISRKSLSMCTELPDRHVRKLISEARANGYAIVGDPNGGYYMAENEDDVKLLLGELMSRMTKLFKCYDAVMKKERACGRIA